MKHKLFPLVMLSLEVAAAQGAAALPASAAAPDRDCVVMPGPTNGLQFRLYTNASPQSAHLFNTFEIEAGGEYLLRSPGGDDLKRWFVAAPANASLHNFLVDGAGPTLASSNGMVVVEQASGPDWSYLALDASAGYRGRLEEYKRAILFVEPDLFILHDHLVARKPAIFEMLLHPPAATRVDAVWRDLRLDLPTGGFRINAPSRRHELRAWEQIKSASDSFLPDTVTMRLAPPKALVGLDLLTVFAVSRGGGKRDYAFKLLEGESAIGARIHRDGLPTLVAFRTAPAAASASLTGFGFNGPVGVDVYKFKPRSPQ